MTNRTSIIILFMLLAYATCSAQTSFQGLTPGINTRADAEKILGVPRDVYWGNVCLYSPPAGLKEVRVTYGDAKPDDIIDQFEIQLLKPVSRLGLIKKFELPEKSDVQRFDSDNKLTELFGGKALIYLSYAGHDASTGVEWIIYYSQRDFQFRCSQGLLKCGAAAPSSSPASSTMTADGAALRSPAELFAMEYDHALNGTTLTYYAKGRMEDCGCKASGAVESEMMRQTSAAKLKADG